MYVLGCGGSVRMCSCGVWDWDCDWRAMGGASECACGLQQAELTKAKYVKSNHANKHNAYISQPHYKIRILCISLHLNPNLFNIYLYMTINKPFSIHRATFLIDITYIVYA